MSRVPLTVLPQVREALATFPPTSCDHCGACCEHVGTPPSSLAVWTSPNFKEWQAHPDSFDADTHRYYSGSLNHPDYSRWLATADELKAETQAWYDSYFANEIPHRYDEGLACLWFDATTRRCRNYDNRPEACRTEVELSDDLCRDFRLQLRKLIAEEQS